MAWLAEGHTAAKALLASWVWGAYTHGVSVCPLEQELSVCPCHGITLLRKPLPRLSSAFSSHWGPRSHFSASPHPHLCPLLRPGGAHLSWPRSSSLLGQSCPTELSLMMCMLYICTAQLVATSLGRLLSTDLKCG